MSRRCGTSISRRRRTRARRIIRPMPYIGRPRVDVDILHVEVTGILDRIRARIVRSCCWTPETGSASAQNSLGKSGIFLD